MSWTRSAEYTALPTSTHPRTASEPVPLGSQPRSTLDPRSRSHARWKLVYWTLGGGAVLLLLSSLFVVPEDQLPTKVSSAVGASKGAFEAAKAKWGWLSQAELDEELAKIEEEELGLEDSAHESKEEFDQAGQQSQGGNDNKELGRLENGDILVGDELDCADEIRVKLGEPSFWTVRPPANTSKTPSTSYEIVPRDPLPPNVPQACLSQSVFSTRLVSLNDTLSGDPQSETLYALPSPILSESLDSYEVSLSSELRIPRGRYELQVTLEFGFYPGVVEGTCGDSANVCEESIISTIEGEHLAYIGKRIEIGDETKTIEIGALAEAGSTLPICSDLSSLDGYWSSLSYHPTSPSPCSLVSPLFPAPFSPDSTSNPAEKTPLWIHFVGDSNTRNMYSHLLNSLGNGHKINAPKVMDSSTHNGTHASFACRWASGEIPSSDQVLPDYLITWSWWYQTTPVSEEPLAGEEATSAWEKNLEANRDDLLKLVDTNLADYLSYANLDAVIQRDASLAKLATTLRPHRTYVSLGSHSEQLSVPGSVSSLDFLLDESTGLSHSKRHSANLRLFTTTHVNPTYIPLDRFPHQDLVRNNAFISSKNSVTRARPEFTEPIDGIARGEGVSRIINIAALTRGITVDSEWMKPGKKGRSPDAVHFRDEVYEEWVRLVWTDLARGVEGVLPETSSEWESRGGIEARRERWRKNRIEDWDDDDGEGF